MPPGNSVGDVDCVLIWNAKVKFLQLLRGFHRRFYLNLPIGLGANFGPSTHNHFHVPFVSIRCPVFSRTLYGQPMYCKESQNY